MNRIYNQYTTKGQALDIKDIDEGSRKVAFYLSRFDVIDSDNDLILPGAFAKSLSERGPGSPSNRKIAFLRYHDWQKQIGKFIELSEDSYGLFAVGELGNSTLGEDALNDYKDGIIREHSIGFRYIQDKINWIEDESKDGGGYFEIKELALWEGSAVTFGANEFTNVIEVAKSAGKEETAQKLSAEIDTIIKAISNGKGTDERLYGLEMKAKYLNAQLLTLANAEPFNKHSVKSEPGQNKDAVNWAEIVAKL